MILLPLLRFVGLTSERFFAELKVVSMNKSLRSNFYLGGATDYGACHSNDFVNVLQSTNDVFPAARQMASVF